MTDAVTLAVQADIDKELMVKYGNQFMKASRNNSE
jgi:hypothetical protein